MPIFVLSKLLFSFVLVGAVSHEKPTHIDPLISTEDYLKNYGINVTEHFFTTKDKYILRAFRLPRPGAPVVMMQHGILASSWCWLTNTPETSAGIVLWNMGYDVWLTNSRGNTYSRNHTTLKTKTKEFWDYSFDDMAINDVPANLENILKETDKKDLTVVAWSQGATQMLIAASGSNKKLIESSVNLFVALSPVTYMKNQKSLLLDIASYGKLSAILEKEYPYGFLDTPVLIPAVVEFLCIATAGKICSITVDSLCGTSPLDGVDAIENLTSHFPAGTSVKDLDHYAQFIETGLMRRYDYGSWIANLKHYSHTVPPTYDLKQIKVKTALFLGTNDALADPTDMLQLAEELNPSTIVFQKEYIGYSHVTWLVGTGSESWNWFKDMETLLKQYNPLPAVKASAVPVVV